MTCKLCGGTGALQFRKPPWSWLCVACDGSGADAMDGPPTYMLRSSYTPRVACPQPSPVTGGEHG